MSTKIHKNRFVRLKVAYLGLQNSQPH